MNIYVSNLNFKTSDESLKAAFEEYGNVFSARVITDKFSGNSRGFGFVEMNDSDGQNAIDNLNGKELDEMTINVTVARPREERPSYGNRQNYNRNNDRGGYRRNDRY
ncbi:MAG: RNA-binding protein [Prevotellaceae bacterium]|jgi:RNA recognition motif-containing protein|nr:RNA-binding protein [Prevotellaceae bacterium]